MWWLEISVAVGLWVAIIGGIIWPGIGRLLFGDEHDEDRWPW